MSAGRLRRLRLVFGTPLVLAALFTGCLSSAQQPAPQQSRAAATPPVAATPAPMPPAVPPSTATQTRVGDLIWSGQSGGFLIRWGTGDLTAQRAGEAEGAAFSAKRLAEPDISADTPDADKLQCSYENKFRLLSVVGSVLSFSDDYFSMCEGAAHPTVVDRYAAVDLRKGGDVYPSELEEKRTKPTKLVKLTDFFAEEDVLRALAADKYVQKALRSREEQTPLTSLSEMMVALKEVGCEHGFDDDLLTRFAFHHLEGDRVAVRLGASNITAHACLKQITELGLLLPVPAALADDLRRAAAGEQGFLMKDVRQIGAKRETVIAAEGRY